MADYHQLLDPNIPREEIAVDVDDDDNKESRSHIAPKRPKVSFHEAVSEAVKRSNPSRGRHNPWSLVADKMKSKSEPSNGPDEDDNIDEEHGQHNKTKFGKSTVLQCLVLLVIVAALTCTLLVPDLKNRTMWDLPLWKWEILALSVISGNLISGCIVRVLLIFTEHNFLTQNRVLYFAYALRRAVRNCLWLSLVLIVWYCIFDSKLERSQSVTLPYVTEILLCFLVASIIWLLKTLLVKVLASSFHMNAYFDRIHDALFHQYVIEVLSSKSILTEKGSENDLSEGLLPKNRDGFAKLGFGRKPKDNISVWYMKKVVNIIQHGSLSTLDEQILEADMEGASHMHIDSEFQTKKAAKKIFINVARPKSKAIYLEDLMRFMTKEEAVKTIRLFGERAESDGFDRKSLENWVIEAFKERVALARSLNDTNTAVDDLHNMLNVIVGIITAVLWLIILGVPVSQFLVFISSQLILLAFVFGNSCKTVFEAIIFLFVMHPYDVGDRCEVDGDQLIVEEMNILTTVFLRSDNLKVRYPNNVLATKAISNFNRSPPMGEAVDFCLHISTPMEKIGRLKQRITEYVENTKEHWSPSPMVIVKDVEDMNRLLMSVWLTHRMNHQDMVERWVRRALLVEHMIEIFRQLEIEYRMLPVDVNVRNPSSISPYDSLPSNWMTCANELTQV